MRQWVAVSAAAWVAGCSAWPGPEPGGGGWIVDVGLPDQDVALAALTDVPADAVDAWLAGRPRAAVDGGFASLAAPFVAIDDDTVHLSGLYDTGDAHLTLISADRAVNGLDHDLSFTVSVRSDADGVAGADHWLGVVVDGDPGCGGDVVPRGFAVFDADRMPVPVEGPATDAELVVAGVRVAVSVPEQRCLVAERAGR